MKDFFKNLLSLLLAIAILAPVLQIAFGFAFGSFLGSELKYAVLTSVVPWFVCVVALIANAKMFRSDEQVIFLGYIVTCLIVIFTCKGMLSESDVIFSEKKWQAFEYKPVDRMLTVHFEDSELHIPSLRKFEAGGFILKRSTETGRFSKLYACPRMEYNKRCLDITNASY